MTFKVFAPDGTGGNGLSEVTNLLCKAIVNADTEGLVDSTKVSAIEYDNSAFTVFRTITLVLDFCLYEEVSV